ncbi:MAG: sulfite exporter TauE/SafE family protein [Verrucomicrobiae bacterium]|nr:sulfite exporter TauE/SafE family protein [Verrucomicrobiae bacterium]
MPYGTALLLGLLGGLHCAGMCGPLMLVLPAVGGTRARFFAGRVVYQAGRVLTYVLMGVAAGWMGRTLALVGIQQGVTLGLGLLMLGGLLVSPRLLELPWLMGWVGGLQRRMGSLLRRRTVISLGSLGALNGLLPCGLVYIAFAGATTMSGGWEGAGYMLMFGLGTVPTMLGISLSGRLVTPAVRARLRWVVPCSIGVVAGLLILRGLSLGIPYLSPDLSGGVAVCCPTGAGPVDAAH